MSGFKKAVKYEAKLRMALIGPPGSGKTYTSLAIACNLGKKVAVIDTEHGSASKYADLFNFDVMELDSFSPATYVKAIEDAQAAGYDWLVVDSLSHAWTGKDGALEQVDRAAARSQSKNTYFAWRDVTPMHNRMIDAIVQAKCHIVATIRSKTEYVVETDSRGKQAPRKIGMAPIQRDGMEYEFDVVGDMDIDNKLIVTKSRCPALSGQVFSKPGADVAAILSDWLKGATPSPAIAPPTPAKPANGNGKPPEQPLPKDGAEFMERAKKFHDNHVAKEKSKPGELWDWLEYRGQQLGFPVDPLTWDHTQIVAGIGMVNDFQAGKRAPAKQTASTEEPAPA